MFFVLSKLLDVALSPLTWGLALLALAAPLRSRDRRRWRRRRALGLAGVAVLLLFSSELVANAMQWRLEHEAPSTYREEVTYDAVILLGGVGDERVAAAVGQPAYNQNVERLLTTYRLLRDGDARLAIVSGAAMDPSLEDFGEARVLARQLREWGIDGERVVVEARARNTRENAVYSAEIVRARGLSRVLVVTSAFHVPRASECFRAVGLEPDFLPVDYRAHPTRPSLRELLPRADALAKSTAVFRELFGRLVYRARGYARQGP